MSKYRILLKPSKQKLYLLGGMWLLLICSIFSWQSDVISHQSTLQIFISLIILGVAFKSIQKSIQSPPLLVIFSEKGEWIEVEGTEQVQWQITDKSKLTSFLLFIHVVSRLNSKESHWQLVFKDQTEQRDFRRLCRSVLFQQHNHNV